MKDRKDELSRSASTEMELPPVTPYGYALIQNGLRALPGPGGGLSLSPEVQEDVEELRGYLEENAPRGAFGTGDAAISRAVQADGNPDPFPEE